MRIDSTEIYEDLQRRLMTAAFKPGERLKPADLQGAYGCSANTVRDVLLRLSKVGLVDFEIQRGFRARATSPERRRDVAKFRILLETEGATQSIMNGGLEWEAELSAAHHKLRHVEQRMALGDNVEQEMSVWSDAERAFHETLISCCDSPLLRETYANIYVQFRQQMVSQKRDFGSNYFQAITREHQAIVDAALARDADACRKAIYDHLKRNL